MTAARKLQIGRGPVAAGGRRALLVLLAFLLLA